MGMITSPAVLVSQGSCRDQLSCVMVRWAVLRLGLAELDAESTPAGTGYGSAQDHWHRQTRHVGDGGQGGYLDKVPLS